MLFHPLASLDWEKLLTVGICQDNPDYRCVLVRDDRIYLGGHFTNKLFAITLNTSSKSASWTEMTTPCSRYALTTYFSRLVIIGGVMSTVSSQEVTDKVWTSDDGVKWETSLPPMSTRRAGASAVNPSSPQCLVVAGGVLGPTVPVLTKVVEVLRDQQWSTVQPLPVRSSGMGSIVHNGNWYLLGSSDMFCCNLNKLLHSTYQTSSQSTIPIWSLVPFSSMRESPLYFQNDLPRSPIFVSVGQDLLALGNSGAYGYSHHCQRWLHVGVLPENSMNKCAVVLPSEEVLLLSQQWQSEDIAIYRLSVRGK